MFVFSENLACFVFLIPPFWDSSFRLNTDELLTSRLVCYFSRKWNIIILDYFFLKCRTKNISSSLLTRPLNIIFKTCLRLVRFLLNEERPILSQFIDKMESKMWISFRSKLRQQNVIIPCRFWDLYDVRFYDLWKEAWISAKNPLVFERCSS